MLENVKRIREPLGWTLLAIVVATLAVGVAQAVGFITGDVAASPDANWSLSIGFLALSLVPYPLVLALLAVVCSCFLAPATPRALLLGRVSVWVLTVAGVAALAGVIYGVRAMAGFGQSVPLDLVASALGLVAALAATVALWVVVWRGGEADEPEVQAALPAAAEEPAEEVAQTPTVWKRPEAAGTAWRTAAEAASGAPGSRYLASDEEDDGEPSDPGRA